MFQNVNSLKNAFVFFVHEQDENEHIMISFGPRDAEEPAVRPSIQTLMDFSTTIKELRTSAPDVPVLAITLSRDAERREQALRAGAGEVLTMDTPPKKIVDVAKQLVGE